VDGAEQPHFLQITPPIFSEDSRHVAYLGARGRRWCTVRDGTVSATKDHSVFAEHARLSGDGRHFSYSSPTPGRGRRKRMVIDGKAGSAYDELGPVVSSPSGSRTAYVAQRRGTTYVVVNGVESNASPLTIQRNYLAFEGDDRLRAPALGGKEIARVEVAVSGRP